MLYNRVGTYFDKSIVFRQLTNDWVFFRNSLSPLKESERIRKEITQHYFHIFEKLKNLYGKKKYSAYPNVFCWEYDLEHD